MSSLDWQNRQSSKPPPFSATRCCWQEKVKPNKNPSDATQKQPTSSSSFSCNRRGSKIQPCQKSASFIRQLPTSWDRWPEMRWDSWVKKFLKICHRKMKRWRWRTLIKYVWSSFNDLANLVSVCCCSEWPVEFLSMVASSDNIKSYFSTFWGLCTRFYIYLMMLFVPLLSQNPVICIILLKLFITNMCILSLIYGRQHS